MLPVESASVAGTVVTAVLPSATLMEADAPPPSLVMSGAVSLVSVTLTVSVCCVACTPSSASTMTS